MICRICGDRSTEILDLGRSPPANSLVKSADQKLESFPLVLEVCDSCGNVQLRDCLDSVDLYRNYLYVTPDSNMLKNHYEYLCRYLETNQYVNSKSFVLEIGSNVGLFLKHIKSRVSKILGIDPAINICKIAVAAGIDTICDFFNAKSAQEVSKNYGAPDVIIARHCFAHNCDPHLMMEAVVSALTPSGYFVIENAYVLNTIENNEFDQIYHEHMFYFSIRSMKKLLALHKMQLVDVLMSLVHGGSIIFVAKKEDSKNRINESVGQYEARESLFLNQEAYARFAANTAEIRDNLSALVNELHSDGKTIFTYGATAKGNTLLNYIGLTNQQIPYCVDSTPIKHGMYLPQSNIKVISEELALANPPDYFLLTAWNYKEEIITKVRGAGNYRTKFIVPIPFVHIV